MEHTPTIAHEHENHSGGGTKEVWRVTIILSVLTLIELALGYWIIGMEKGFLLYAIKGSIVILMMAKAFYIVAYFMHLKHELRNMIMTIVVPLLLFVWFIAAFLYDGDSYLKLNNRYDRYKQERSETKVAPKHGENHSKEKKPANGVENGKEIK